MTSQLSEIGCRLSALREIMDVSAESIAKDLGISLDEYSEYEKGERDFSFSFLYNAANILGVDVVDIISGESSKLDMCALVRAGEGYDIAHEFYDYKHLAFTFRNKKAEPFMVTVSHDPAEKPELHSHDGQEFNYMVEGTMEIYHGDSVYTLNKGDSLYFDSSIPHAMKAIGNAPAQFIAVVIK